MHAMSVSSLAGHEIEQTAHRAVGTVLFLSEIVLVVTLVHTCGGIILGDINADFVERFVYTIRFVIHYLQPVGVGLANLCHALFVVLSRGK